MELPAKDVIAKNIARFPAEFSLRAFRQETFRIAEWPASFVDGDDIHLVTQRKVGDKWLDFIRCSPRELRLEIVEKKAPQS